MDLDFFWWMKKNVYQRVLWINADKITSELGDTYLIRMTNPLMRLKEPPMKKKIRFPYVFFLFSPTEPVLFQVSVALCGYSACMLFWNPQDKYSIDVYKVLKEINTNKATGPDKISGRIVKQCTTSLLYIIHSIFNISLDLCRMPNLWNIGEIIPVNKKPLPKVDNDLRPVTLTAILAKCFERVILPKISSHTKPIMDKLQFAYLPNRSTDDATTTLIHELSQHLDRESKSKYARCLFIDYFSAFNTMQPHTLINRLAEYNIPARLQLFVLDFLTDRKQYVRTEIELSSTTSINTGAPQGCVLSAFLFIIYTNALSRCSTTWKIIKYVDDTVVIGLINNDNEQEYRDTVSYVSSWCNENHLNLNAGKTKEMIFDFRKIQNDKAPIIINNTSVKQVPSYKYLGVIIQNNLKWNEHVTAQVKKADQRMYHVRRLSKLKIDNKILRLFYCVECSGLCCTMLV